MMFEELMAEVQELLGDGFEVEDTTVTKNNGTKRRGLNIGRIGSAIRPTIYPTEKTTAKDIVQIFRNNEIEDDSEYGNALRNIMNDEYVQANVFPALINREKNAELLQSAVHKPCADLEIIYKIKVKGFEGRSGLATITVKDEHLGILGITADELHDMAMKNVQGKGQVRTIAETIKSMGGPSISEDDVPMFVVSNKEGCYGAGVIFDDAVIAELHDRVGMDFVIIPSSVHEIIVLPRNKIDSIKWLTDMIIEVNRTEVSAEEMLSDNAYIYTDRLEVA